MSFKVEVKVIGEPHWVGNALRFATWGEAHDYGLDLGNRWTQVEEMRTVESTDPVRDRWVDGAVVEVVS